MRELFTDLVNDCPQLKRGKVWCTVCGTEKDVDAAECLAKGWPECCGRTMTVDSPEERKVKRA
jgi:hypothetical protein